MDNLMQQLEKIVLNDFEGDNTNVIAQKDDEITDWDILKKNNKGTDRINNANICLLENLKLEHDIFYTALNYYNTIFKIKECKRIKFKNAVMCACVLMAFSIHHNHREEQSLFNHFGINKNQYTKALRLVKTLLIETRPVKKTFDNDLFHLCREMNIIDDIESVKQFISMNCASVSKYSKRTSSKIINCILLYVWILRNKNTIPTKKTFASLCNISCKSIIQMLYRNKFLFTDYIEEQIQKKTTEFISLVENQYHITIRHENYSNSLGIYSNKFIEKFILM